MPDAIGPLNGASGLGGIGRITPRPAPPKTAADGFGTMVNGLVDQVNLVQHEASDAIAQFATGDGENLHEVMLAVSKADVSFKFLMETRNKLVEAYQEVMRMQL